MITTKLILIFILSALFGYLRTDRYIRERREEDCDGGGC